MLLDWVLKRGVLFVLLLSPVGALMLGLFRIVPNRLGYVVLLLSFLALPIWITWRRSRSDDPDEPVHHLHRYALYSLFPYVVFSVVRIPTFYLFDFSYWAPWYTFGHGSTGEPAGFYSSLLPGAALYSLQGHALSMGFYTLFKRHNLLNATLYFGVFISALYSFVFPVFLLAGSKPGGPFHVVNFWAHTWMGVTAAFMPVFFQRVWPRLRATGRAFATAGLVAVWLSAYAFAFGQATFWQFDRERVLEEAAFAKITVEPTGSSVRTAAADETRYSVTMRLGPRRYVTYAHVHKAVGVDRIHVDGRLVRDGVTVASCTADVGALPGMRHVRDPEKYFPALAQLDHTTIPVACKGTPEAAAGSVTFEWTARMVLHGERETRPRDFAGTTQLPVVEG